MAIIGFWGNLFWPATIWFSFEAWSFYCLLWAFLQIPLFLLAGQSPFETAIRRAERSNQRSNERSASQKVSGKSPRRTGNHWKVSSLKDWQSCVDRPIAEKNLRQPDSPMVRACVDDLDPRCGTLGWEANVWSKLLCKFQMENPATKLLILLRSQMFVRLGASASPPQGGPTSIVRLGGFGGWVLCLWISF